MKAKNLNLRKYQYGLNYFTNRRDYFISKMRETKEAPQISDYFKRKAEDMTQCIEKILRSKKEVVQYLN